MKKALLAALALFFFISSGYTQDLIIHRDKDQFPLWYSSTKVLVKFKDATKNNFSQPSELAHGVKEIIEGYQKDYAFLTFASKDELMSALPSLRSHENVVLAHPLLVNESGEEAAGFTDLLIVKLKKGFTEQNALDVFKKNGLEIKEVDAYQKDIYYLSGQSVMDDPNEVATKLYETGVFDFSQPNCLRFVKPAGVPNDPLYSANWGLPIVKAAAAWDVTSGCFAIKIAVIDDGVLLTHADLSGNLLPGADVTGGGTNGGVSAAGETHGTIVAGIAAATGNNGIGVAGIASNSKIIPIRGFTYNSNGTITDKDMAASFFEAVARNADVIVMSWTIANGTAYYTAINNALNNATTAGRGGKGCFIAAASGNAGSALHVQPADIQAVTMVGSSTASDTRNPDSNYGTNSTRSLDIVSPGAQVSTAVTGGYTNLPSINTTSYAAPIVAGTAALILSINSNLTNLQVKRIIAETADKVGGYTYSLGNSTKFTDLTHNNEMGFGRLNIQKAVERAAGGPITGADFICTSASYSLSAFSSLPSGSTFSWSTSNSSALSINSSGTATRLASYVGSVEIRATITIPGASCNPTILRKKVWVGGPSMGFSYYTSNGNQYGLVESEDTYPNTICWNGNPTSTNVVTTLFGTTSASWTKISSTPASLLWSSTGFGNMSITFKAIGEKGVFRLTTSNVCGSITKFHGFQAVSCAGFTAFPNPASDELTIQFENTESLNYLHNEIQLIDEKSQKNVKTVNLSEIFVLKQFENGNQIKLKVSDLPRGTYYLRGIPAEGSKMEVETLRILLE